VLFVNKNKIINNSRVISFVIMNLFDTFRNIAFVYVSGVIISGFGSYLFFRFKTPGDQTIDRTFSILIGFTWPLIITKLLLVKLNDKMFEYKQQNLKEN
jgi:hypothetical protein